MNLECIVRPMRARACCSKKRKSDSRQLHCVERAVAIAWCPILESMPTDHAPSPPHLPRELGLGSALALNMLEMVGVGPFITLPLIVAAMGGPQAMLGWVLGAALALCDGLVWAELAA